MSISTPDKLDLKALSERVIVLLKESTENYNITTRIYINPRTKRQNLALFGANGVFVVLKEKQHGRYTLSCKGTSFTWKWETVESLATPMAQMLQIDCWIPKQPKNN